MWREFLDGLERVNRLAEVSPGFVWRLVLPEGHVVRDGMFANLSVWESYETLHRFLYRSGHGDYTRRRRRWFDQTAGPTTVLWWIDAADVRPSLERPPPGSTTSAATARRRGRSPCCASSTPPAALRRRGHQAELVAFRVDHDLELAGLVLWRHHGGAEGHAPGDGVGDVDDLDVEVEAVLADLGSGTPWKAIRARGGSWT